MVWLNPCSWKQSRVSLSTHEWFSPMPFRLPAFNARAPPPPGNFFWLFQRKGTGSSWRSNNYQHGGFEGNLPGFKNSWVVNPGSQWFGSQTMANCQLGPDCHIEAQKKGIIPENWGVKDRFNFVAKTKQDNRKQNENLFLGIEAHWGAESYTLWSDSSQEIIIGYTSQYGFN